MFHVRFLCREYVGFENKMFPQATAIPKDTNCALLLARKSNLTCRYIDDILMINNPDIQDYIKYIYPPEPDQGNNRFRFRSFISGTTLTAAGRTHNQQPVR